MPAPIQRHAAWCSVLSAIKDRSTTTLNQWNWKALSACDSPQLTAFFTSAPIRFSSAAVNFISAKATGHM
jgi:hypothetical protein